MKKIFIALLLTTFLTGCFESIAMFGAGVGNGKIVQSSVNSALSLGIKKSTGKTPTQHVLSALDKKSVEEELEASNIDSSPMTVKKETPFLTVIKKETPSSVANNKEVNKVENICTTYLCSVAKKNYLNLRYSIQKKSSIENLN